MFGIRARSARPAGPRDQHGAAAVEFALLLPILILLVFGIVQFSILYNHQQGLHAAAREGARVAALPSSTSTEITSRVRDSLRGVLNDADRAAATITVTPSGTRPCDLQPAGTNVVVAVSVPGQLDIPLWGDELLTLTGRGQFRCE